MTSDQQINSGEYWDGRFSSDWESFDGPKQSRFFAELAIANLPPWLLQRIRQDRLSLVDWGCAQGDGTDLFRSCMDSSRIAGVDFSGIAIEEAASRYPAIRFLAEDWLSGDGNGEVFDVLFSSNTLEHFHNPYEVLAAISGRAGKAIALALPYRETERIDEHFFSFLPHNIPLVLANGFRLAWSKVVDCKPLPGRQWDGEQVILVYAAPEWLQSLELTLADLVIEQDDRDAAFQLAAARLPLERLLTESKAEVDQLKAKLAESEERQAALTAQNVALQRQSEQQAAELVRVSSWAQKIATQPAAYALRRTAYLAARSAYQAVPLSPVRKNAIRTWLLSNARRLQARLHNRGREAAGAEMPVVVDSDLYPPQRDVLVFSVIDWHFRFQRPQQLAKSLAKLGRRVFFIGPAFVDTLVPGYQVERIDPSLDLFNVRLHLAGSPAIYFAAPTAEAQRMLEEGMARLLGAYGATSSVSIVEHPYWFPLARKLPNSYRVYDCMDHHEGFGNVPAELVEIEKEMLRTSDLVVATSSWLEHFAREHNSQVAVVRNAGEYDHFASRPSEVFTDPGQRKIIGYYGAIAEWFDLDLVRAVATRNRDALVLLVGNDTAGAAQALAGLPNVQFVGEVPYARLPYYLYAFDVCLLPFKVIPLTLATNPVKVYEYLASGKTIVCVDLPEIEQFGDLVVRAKDSREFVEKVALALRETVPAEVGASRRRFAAEQTWEHRASELAGALQALPMPRISVIVLTFNNLDFTRACLDSVLRETDYPNLELIVVDNASTDGTPAWLEDFGKAHPDAKVILNDRNLGFAAGNNVGLAAATGDYFVVLNNDTVVTRGWALTLLRHLQSDRSLGLVGPVTNNIGNEARIPVLYADIADMKAEALRFTLRHPARRFPLRTAAFFCVMFARSTYESCGPICEDYGRGFFEDDDYCRRLESTGMGVACAEDVFVHHHLSASFNKLSTGDRTALFEQNKAIYEAKWGQWKPHTYQRDRPGMAAHPALAAAPVPTAFAGQQSVHGMCNICGHRGRFFFSDRALWRESLTCEKCLATSRYRSIARGILAALHELAGLEVPSLAAIPKRKRGARLRVYDTQPPFYYSSCAYPLPDMLKATGWIDVELSQYKPRLKPGQRISAGVTNQNLECLTFDTASLDIVITSDVMEHVRLDREAHAEIHRVLRVGGMYVFTVPHQRASDETLTRVQVTDPADASKDVHLLEPEYHGDTNGDGSGVLSYRVYGRDLEAYLESLGFEVRYSKDELPEAGILNTELYLCKKLR